MILNGSNLKIVDIVKVDKAIPMLNNIHVDSDGITSAIGSKIMLVMSAVRGVTADKVSQMHGWIARRFSLTIPANSVKEVLKNIPKDSQFSGLLEHVELDSLGKFKLSDGRQQRTIKCIPWKKDYPDWRKIWKEQKSKSVIRAVYNRKRLLLLLQTMEKVCEDTSGYSPVWLEVSADNTITLRAVNMKTGQKALGLVGAYEGREADWLSDEEFELKKKPLPKKRAK